MTDALELYERLCADDPADHTAWIAAHVPAHTHVQTWGAVNSLLTTDAMYVLVDPDHHPRADLDRAVNFVVAALDSGRVPSFMGIGWLGTYVRWAGRHDRSLEHPALDPDDFGRRVLACLPPRSEVIELAGRVRVAERRVVTDLGSDSGMWLGVRSIGFELAQIAPRIKDPLLATAVAQWLELLDRLDSSVT